jgi:hypothetical protein
MECQVDSREIQVVQSEVVILPSLQLPSKRTAAYDPVRLGIPHLYIHQTTTVDAVQESLEVVFVSECGSEV